MSMTMEHAGLLGCWSLQEVQGRQEAAALLRRSMRNQLSETSLSPSPGAPDQGQPVNLIAATNSSMAPRGGVAALLCVCGCKCNAQLNKQIVLRR
jgi:hypothetical protein